MTAIPFIKMQGAGNDFVVLDAFTSALPADFDYSAAAQQWCARHTGVGSDGLLLLSRPTAEAAGATVRMRMWNPDGSEDMCGNGLRCIAHLAHSRGYAGATFQTQTLVGLRNVEILKAGHIRIAMGHPDLNPATIPLQLDGEQGATSGLDYILPLDHILLPQVTTLSTGSTHTVIFCHELPDDAFFKQLSPLIEYHPWFPQRTSIMWCQVIDRHHLKLRIWERGAGETLACGTGACAAAVAAQMTGRCDSGIDAQSRGGTLHIEWQPDAEIRMTGPARIVCAGSVPALATQR